MGTYVLSDADHAAYYGAAQEAYGGEHGEYDWLRLYFEEVIWPTAEEQLGRISAFSSRDDARLLRLDVSDSPEKEEWLKTSVACVFEWLGK